MDWSHWRHRLLIAGGLAVVLVGVAYFVTGPGESAHYHDDPTPGDLHTGGGVMLIVVGGFAFINGLFFRSRDR
jgi:hypothetical protein